MEQTSAALVACLRTSPSAQHSTLLASLTPEDWTEVFDLAARHGVTSQLSEPAIALAPPEAAVPLRKRGLAAARRALHQKAEFLALASALEPLGIPVIALKGIHLALAVYPPSVTREMADIDILVQHDQLDVVVAAARRLGYRDNPKALARVAHHVPGMVKPGVMLEIHWRLAEEGTAPVADAADLWTRAKRLAFGTNVFALAPEDALLHVCAHAAYSHYYEHGIRPLCDIRALVSSGAIDWDAVATRADAWRCARGTALALALARDLLAVPVPAVAIQRLGGEPPPDVVAATTGQIFSDRSAIHGVSARAGQLLALPTLTARAAGVLRALKLPATQVAALYPHRRRGSRVAAGLATVRRMADLIRRYAWTLLQLTLHPRSRERTHVERRNHVLTWLQGG